MEWGAEQHSQTCVTTRRAGRGRGGGRDTGRGEGTVKKDGEQQYDELQAGSAAWRGRFCHGGRRKTCGSDAENGTVVYLN